MVKSKAIKICHLTSAHKADDVRIFHKECSSLAKNGFDVYLVVANCEETLINGVHIINAKAPTSGRFTRILNTSRIVYKKALELNADIYQIHDPELLPYALKLKRKGKKVIYDAHEDVPKQILGKFWINKYLRTTVAMAFKKYENRVAKQLDYILTATPFIRDRFSKINSSCIDINNFPLLTELSTATDWSKKKNEVCYIGAISEIRGINQFIDSLHFLKSVKANVAGTFSPENIRDKIESKPGWQNVQDHGYVGRAETMKIMAKSKIGIVTFLPLPNHVDAQPNKMFEYMSASIPVVASNFPLWRDIIEKNNCGICVDPEKPKDIAEAISSLLNDDQKAEQLGKNGHQAVINQYNWEVEEKKLISIYIGL